MFHYAFKVKDLASTRRFYMDILGCDEGRSAATWVDFNFFGNQLSAHLTDAIPPLDYCGKVDGIAVPMPHFGCIVEAEVFHDIKDKMKSGGVEFIIQPTLRYKGKTGEQWTMFVLDFSGNPIEFKAFTRKEEVFSV